MDIHPIILCGGPGSRLWPASRAHAPKPFIDLLGGRSLFQRTVLRMAALPGAKPPVVVTGHDHVRQARRQLRAIGVEAVIIAEPAARESGPALLAAAAWIERADPEGVAVAVASDHHIPDQDAFAAAVAAAAAAARGGDIVTFGVRPDGPAVAYGYIRLGEALSEASDVRRVARFVEKPDAARAKVLVAEGCLWNSGNFMCRADALLREAQVHAPAMVEAVRRAVADGVEEDGVFILGAAFAHAPKVSIDVAVMEQTTRAAVLPIDYAWSDLGAWDAVWASSARDGDGNAVSGLAVAHDSRNCLVRAGPGARVLALGLSDIAVVVEGHNVLVTALEHASRLKPAVAALDGKSTCRAQFLGLVDHAAAVSAGPRLRTWLWERALPLWWCFGADHAGGGFHEQLGQDLAPVAAPRRARVQARQIHVYAAAGALGWPGPWKAAVDHGLNGLFGRYERRDGLFRASVAPSGAVLDDGARLYDQAFILLAMATTAFARPDRLAELEARARELAAAVARTFGRDSGWRADEASEDRLANPVMHLFEAVLAWIEASDNEVSGRGFWWDIARRIADLALDRMIPAGGGAMREVFDDAWAPFPGAAGRVIEPGHQFEWAWLLERWARMSGDDRARPAAAALYAWGDRGVDPRSGLVVDALLDDGVVHLATSRLWPQTERLKAALFLAPDREAPRSAHFAAAESAAAAIEAYLDTPIAGLWRDTPHASGPQAGAPALASSFYHLMGAITALDGAQAGPGVA